MSDTIICPSCQSKIEITEALTSQIGARIRQEAQAELRRKLDEAEAANRRRQKEQDDREETLKKKANQLEQSQRDLAAEVEKQVAQHRKAVEQEEKRKAEEAVELRLKEAEDKLADEKKKRKALEDNELKLRREREALEDEKDRLELTVQQKLDAEKQKIREATRKQVEDERQIADRQKDEKINDLVAQIAELKRRAEQGSQQSQGEAMELVLEALLRGAFPHDAIEPVPKGVHGGDIVQRVRSEAGIECGTVLWESKRTKHWSDKWLSKLRDDQRTAKAEQAVIVSECLPEGVGAFDRIDGIWVTDRKCLMGLATALRLGMIQVAKTARANEGHKEKAELIYDYLTGSDFRHRVQGIVEAFGVLKDQVEKERKAMTKQWAEREKQLELAMRSTVGMYGDLQGIAGRALPQIQALELPPAAEKE